MTARAILPRSAVRSPRARACFAVIALDRTSTLGSGGDAVIERLQQLLVVVPNVAHSRADTVGGKHAVGGGAEQRLRLIRGRVRKTRDNDPLPHPLPSTTTASTHSRVHDCLPPRTCCRLPPRDRPPQASPWEHLGSGSSPSSRQQFRGGRHVPREPAASARGPNIPRAT